MTQLSAARSGQFTIGGEITVNRLGFGAMRVTGRGIWGEPENRAESLRMLKRLPEIGVNFIDTADSYGPDVSENLFREALHPYPADMLIATKAGLTRSGPNVWIPKGQPDYLIEQAKKSLTKLGIDQIGLWQLHRIDSKVPRGEQFGAIRKLLDDGVSHHDHGRFHCGSE
jgi:pyridoxine 4-dehydrogenase